MQKTKIFCELCEQEISINNYSKHLRRHQLHPETFEREMFHLTHNDFICKFCGKMCKNKNSTVQHEIRCRENPDKINTIVDGFNNYNRPGWNKGLTKETDERVLKGSITYKENHKKGLHKDTHGLNNNSSNPNVKEKISATCLKKSKEGTWHTSLAKNMHIDYKGVDLHGSYELAYAKYLDEHNISWIRCKDRFEYYYNNSYHYYTPDFYLIDTKEYIEIKGYATGKDYAKWKQFPEDKTLIVLKKKDLINLGINVL